ncbi:unnamed protein product, partial [Ranitomeya imitator]
MSGIKGGANCQKSSCQNLCKDPCQKVPICVNPCQDPCQSGSQYSGYSNQQGRGQFPKQVTSFCGRVSAVTEPPWLDVSSKTEPEYDIAADDDDDDDDVSL